MLGWLHEAWAATGVRARAATATADRRRVLSVDIVNSAK
jgi:hypothetical protein